MTKFAQSSLLRQISPPEIDKDDLRRKANLSNLIRELKHQIPHILETNLSRAIISRDIYLRICPSQVDESVLPKLHGTLAYYSACKAIQLFICSVMLSPRVKLHITNIRTTTTNNNNSSPDPQCMYPNSTKVYVRWNTCMPNCEHLGAIESTSHANLGSHKWSPEDTIKLMNAYKLNSLAGIVAKLTSSVMSLSKESEKLERVLSGLFIFELNEECDAIMVHTVENMDIIERFEPEGIDNGLRVC
ncbi:uncharacterized protein LODBEIA_P43030 [Lodderomyces beijingensis]|uniref:Uncharacterized protein n=1 Tax=Lodderomyces beijingensis TaxID=1775926 RepID=A0ABP0ZPK9_9ASCO